MGLIKDILESQKELRIITRNKKEVRVRAKFGPSKITKIPLKINEELGFFVASIIGDGHLRQNKYQIVIEGTDKYLLEYIQKICKNLFQRKFSISNVKLRKKRKQSFVLIIDSKGIYQLLERVFEIPKGKKSHIVKIPKYILSSSKSVKSAFLIGIMMTEGGKRKRGFGLSTSSELLWNDLIRVFEELKIRVLKDKWLYQKYKKEYYGISFKPLELKILMRECRSGQTGQILLNKFKI